MRLLSMECCSKCFDDKDLKYIVSTNAIGVGDCKFCGSKDEVIARVNELQYKFEFLLNFMQECDEGRAAASIIDEYFNIFSAQLGDKRVLLLDSVLKLTISQKLYKPKWSKLSSAEHWDELRNELKSKNRYFPQSSLYKKITKIDGYEDFSVFFKVLEQLEYNLAKDESLYRARLSDQPLSNAEMGAPPFGQASSGRANPFGISYLYMASTIDTALSEVRPFNDGIVYICNLLINDEYNLSAYNNEPIVFIDLTNPRRNVSPFVFSEDEYEQLIYSLSLLEKFSSDLSKPVKPHKSELEYLPTQFICEYIKSLKKYKGIIFNSSFGTGRNFVAFDANLFIPQIPKTYKIHRTNYEHSET